MASQNQQRRRRRQERHKYAYLKMKNSTFHALRVHFLSFVHFATTLILSETLKDQFWRCVDDV